MTHCIVDLHIHSKYSRACSKALELPAISAACLKKGIDIVSTGDFTHPLWLAHLEECLEERQPGLFGLKGSVDKTRFILGTEVSCIYKHKDKTRRLHLLLFTPSFAAVKKIIAALEGRKANLKADGRPILGVTAKDMLKIALEADPRSVVIPAHAWTPWFAVFGSKSGYDSLEECFEELAPHVRAIETGLSSDPVMNRRLSKLDGITLISNSDAHGLENLGREANVLEFPSPDEISYDSLMQAIQSGDRSRFSYTIEFYPEEGKYHADGHAPCKVHLEPPETKRENGLCPICKKPLTIGVLHRVEELADRSAAEIPRNRFVPHRYIVPLREIIGQVLGVGVASKKVKAEYDRLIQKVGSEFFILLDAALESIREASNIEIAEAIDRMRQGDVRVVPGYDGIYGVIEVVPSEVKNGSKQRTLFT